MRFQEERVRNYLRGSILILLILGLCTACDHRIELRSDRTTSAAREVFHDKLISKTIHQALGTPLTDSSEALWQGAFWAMELSGYTSARTDSAVFSAMAQFKEHTPGFQRALLEVIFTCYPTTFRREIAELLPLLNSEKLYAMAIHYLLRADPLLDPQKLLDDLDMLYPEWPQDPILWSLVQTLEDSLALPPVRDLLASDFVPGLPILFSFQPENRDFSGRLIIRDSNGVFHRNPDGSLFAIRQLGRAVTNLPWYLTNGNTPPGIYSFNGLGRSDNVFIGPTPTLQMRMPFETDLGSFLHAPGLADEWDFQFYESLLPPSWRSYFPIWGSYFAGQAGRSEIIAHGSTINPEYYQDLPCYPMTPSLGCLTAYEAWSAEDGSLIVSEQQQLVDQMRKLRITKGLVVVIPLPGIEHNLGIEDVERLFTELHPAQDAKPVIFQ
jgi:hypothetical protein